MRVNSFQNSYMCIVGSRFSDRAHYNEFVESGSKSWALMRRRLVLGTKSTQNRAAQRPKERGPLARGRECANPSRSHRILLPISRPPCFWASFSFLAVPLFGWSLLLYIPLFCSSSFYTCQSSIPILKCTSHQPFFLALCELLWPPPHRPGVTSTSMGSGCQLCVFNTEVTTFPGAAAPPFSYGQPIWLGISFTILEWMSSGDMALFSPMILVCRGQGHPRQYILAVWIPFIRPQVLLPPRCEPWA